MSQAPKKCRGALLTDAYQGATFLHVWLGTVCWQVSRSASGPCPAIIVPHGGPHTALAVNYYMPFSFLTALGYCVIAVNYRGSLGFGEAVVQSLPGHVGRNDVEDCMAALDAAVAVGERFLRSIQCGETLKPQTLLEVTYL